jgi:TetR/AcrR family transcriptional repressor of nem operon
MKKTEKLLIDITFDLLYKKGYCATSMTNILDVANMTKGAVYYHFPTKQALVLATITHYLEQILEDHWVKVFEDSEKPVETLVNQINAYAGMYASKDSFLNVKHGCPLSNFIMDMSDKDDEFFKYLESVYARWQESVEKALTKAKILKQTKTDFDPKKQALFIISSIEGCICSAKAHNDISKLKDSFKVLTTYIESL